MSQITGSDSDSYTVLLGPTFGYELTQSGVNGWPIGWGASRIWGISALTPTQLATLNAIIGAHDPTKVLQNKIRFETLIGRFTDAEYQY
jgi:hypothetical protein